MKNRRRDFIAGMLTMALLIGLVGTAGATVGKRTAELDYNNIQIALDGKTITPKDVNGNIVEPFAINGTVYLPVRAVGNALGLGVGWEQSTSTVNLVHLSGNTVSQTPTPVLTPVPVATPTPTPAYTYTPTPAPVSTPTPVQTAPVSVNNGYGGAPWIPDFGRVNGLTPSYFNASTSLYAIYVVPSFDAVEYYVDVLESVGMSYDKPFTDSIIDSGSGTSPVVFSYNGNPAYSVVIDVGRNPGEITLFVPRVTG